MSDSGFSGGYDIMMVCRDGPVLFAGVLLRAFEMAGTTQEAAFSLYGVKKILNVFVEQRWLAR